MGKILISAFIHDECLLEIHKSIDPAKMLKMLRTSMMLNIPGWCKLYTGCGFGTNWYDAKKTEIPVQVQEQIQETWGDTGLDWWDGDTDRLFYWEVGLINDYKRDRVIDYVKNKNNWGKVLSPVENGFAHEVLDEIKKGRHVDGVINKDVTSKKDMLENLEQFCIAFDILDIYKQADIKKPDYSATQVNQEETIEDEEDLVDGMTPDELIQNRISIMGVCFANEGGVNSLFFRYDPNDKIFMKQIHNVFVRNSGSIPVYTYLRGKKVSANLKVNNDAYRQAMSLYMTKRNLEITNKNR